jgi:hypothetical protein
MTEKEPGGVEWELGKALELMQQGLLRFSEALRNGASSASAAQLIPMLEGLDAVRDDRREDAASMEHSLGMVLDQAEIEQADMAKLLTRMALVELAIEDLTKHLDARG